MKWQGRFEAQKFFIDIGPSNYVIRYASENGHLEVVRYLVSVGADVHADDNLAIKLSLRRDHKEVVDYLGSVG